MRRTAIVPPDAAFRGRAATQIDLTGAAAITFDSIKGALETVAEAVGAAATDLQALIPAEEPKPLLVPGVGQRRSRESSESVDSTFGNVLNSVAFRQALRGVAELKEQMESGEFSIALGAIAELRDRIGLEAKRHQDLEFSKRQEDSYRIESLDERLRQADSQVDLLRNSVARRDCLLAEQRSAYYRDLLQYKGDHAGAAPAPTYEEMMTRGPPVLERPQFFDAMVFEVLHLALDMQPSEKATAALKLASERELAMKSRGASDSAEARREANDERKKRQQLEDRHREQMVSLKQSVDQRVHDGVEAAIVDVRRKAAEDVELAWERYAYALPSSLPSSFLVVPRCPRCLHPLLALPPL